jgi:microcystin-dependent protein
LGETGGEQTHTLSISEIPTHNHTLNATSNTSGIGNTPANNLMLSQSTGANVYAGASNLQAMSPNAVSNVGGSQPHVNMQPYLTLNFSIALQGVFPSQN